MKKYIIETTTDPLFGTFRTIRDFQALNDIDAREKFIEMSSTLPIGQLCKLVHNGITVYTLVPSLSTPLKKEQVKTVLYMIPFAMESIRSHAKTQKWRPSELAMTLGEISQLEDDLRKRASLPKATKVGDAVDPKTMETKK